MPPKSRNILQIVDRQVRRWELERAKSEARPAEKRPWPLISISREFAAQGTTLARAIADRTGFTVWDTELVHAVAEETGANTRILESLEEQHRTAIEDAIQGALMGTAYMRSDYMHGLMQVVHTIATHGASVVVGRGSYLILDPDTILRIRLVSPLEVRIKWHAEKTGLSEREARHVIEKTDKERAEFVRDYFKRDIRDASLFDLVLNAAAFSIDSLVDIVLFAYDAKFGRRPKSRL